MTLSIIICSPSAKSKGLDSLLQNIEDTITAHPHQQSFDHEVVIIENPKRKYNLFEAYNKGVEKAKGNILCFMHDDIEYLDTGWGERVTELFSSNPSIGACSVAGCQILRKSPSLFGISKYNAINIQKHDGQWLDTCNEPVPLATFDGLWFCISRKCFETIAFDQDTFSGFHFYDMDTAVQLHAAGYSIMFIPHIPIRHNGKGATDVEWLTNSYKFYRKNKHLLPIITTEAPPSPDEMLGYEQDSIYTSLRLILRYRQWKLLKTWWKMASEVQGIPQPAASIKVLKRHFSKK